MEISWNQFCERTKDRSPHRSLVRALEFVSKKSFALDVGAGGLRDSKHLLKEGFKRVWALDSAGYLEKMVKSVNDSRLKAVKVDFQKYEFPENKFDLVNAQFCLPFIESKERLKIVIDKLKKSLVKGGVIVITLFGSNDEWNKSGSEMTFATEEEARGFFDDLEILDLKEIEKDQKKSGGKMKHWHILEVVARKN